MISLLPPSPPAATSVALMANHDSSGHATISVETKFDTHEELKNPSQLMWLTLISPGGQFGELYRDRYGSMLSL